MTRKCGGTFRLGGFGGITQYNSPSPPLYPADRKVSLLGLNNLLTLVFRSKSL
jgi:hypothetical protein